MKTWKICLLLCLSIVLIGAKGGCNQSRTPSVTFQWPSNKGVADGSHTEPTDRSYPKPTDRPSPMNPKTADLPYHFVTAYYDYSAQTKIDDYNPDGTLSTTPVILEPAPQDGLGNAINPAVPYAGYPVYVFKKLSGPHGGPVVITDASIAQVGSYPVYSTIPLDMTVSQAYVKTNSPSYYLLEPPFNAASPPTPGTWNLYYSLFIQWPITVEAQALTTPVPALPLINTYPGGLSVFFTGVHGYRTVPHTLNSGKPFDLNTLPKENSLGANTSDNTPEQVKVVKSGYYLPYVIDNNFTQHNILTDNVVWTTDIRMDFRTAIPNSETAHLLPYGWALDAGDANSSLSVYQLKADGGSNHGTTVLGNDSQPSNSFMKIFTNNPCQYKVADKSFPKGQYRTMAYNYIKNTLMAGGGPGYPFPDPVWLQNGTFSPMQPMPGFQRNLIRWFTPFGSFNLINNTSDLFIRANGDVEIPVQANGMPYPLVVQTWTDQKYVILNNCDEPIPSSTDTYPGGEIYLAGNTYFQHAAGIMTSYKSYMFYDGDSFTHNNALTPRTPDNWLGLRGETMSAVMNWADANNTEPGGQADKPYMYAVNVHPDGTSFLEFKHANSAPVAIQSNNNGNLYNAKIYIDQDGASGYQLLVTFTCVWQQMTLQPGTNNIPIWTASTDPGQGAIVPGIKDFDSAFASQLGFGLNAFAGTGISGARGVSFDKGTPYHTATPQQNVADGPYYQFILNGALQHFNAKILVVLDLP